jgi:hypothetical protein
MVESDDLGTMDRILADDFVLVLGNGTTASKADLLKEARDKAYTDERQDEIDQTVRVWGDTAVVSARL